MKAVLLMVSVLAGSAVYSVLGDTVSTSFPGRCLTTKECEAYGKGLACVAVDSNIAGLEKLSMCVPAGDAVCSGSLAGACPTFSSWPTKYRKVQSVCAFQVAPNCNTKIEVTVNDKTGSASAGDANGEIEAGDATTEKPLLANETVECYTRNFTANGESKVINGIYQCMDVKKYVETNGGHLKNLTDSQVLACGGKLTDKSITLCNGQGTCAPKTAFAQEYECKCNKGFDGDKNCATVTSNECSNLGQCGAKGTCALEEGKTSGTCACKEGSVGNQCATCDATKGSAACNDHGTCENGSCKCTDGYTGTFCSDVPSTGGGSSTDSAAVAVSQLTSRVAAALAIAASLTVMVFA